MNKEQAFSEHVKKEYQKELDLYISEVDQFLTSIYSGQIERNYKKENYVFNFYLPEKQIVIDCLSLYFDSELYRANQYNQNKFKYLKENNIKLIQFASNDWFDKKDICKNIIRCKLGLSQFKINARNCTVEYVLGKNENVESFLNKYHLQGNVRCKIAFILRDKFTNEIYEILTLRAPYTKKWGGKENIEIARFAVRDNTSVRGGYSKLLSKVLEWCRQNGYIRLLTYSACSYSWGETYCKTGACFVEQTSSMYFYVGKNNKFKEVSFRFKHKARDGKSEKQCALEDEIYRFYIAGNQSWLYDLTGENL